MKGILRDIVQHKKKELAENKKQKSLSELMQEAKPAERDFKQALESKRHAINLIAEIKKASPSAGIIRQDFDVKQIASLYDKHAQAISIITDEKFFQGNPSFIKEAKSACSLPILRKDFIVDEYQLYESLALGADAVLLIAAIVSRQKLQQFVKICNEIELTCLVEIHSSQDFERAFSHEVEIIGINNRDLETMKVNLKNFESLRGLIPSDRVIVAESGYLTQEDISSLRGKADAVLIGSALMSEKNIEQKLVELGF